MPYRSDFALVHHSPKLSDVELFHARYERQSFPRHAHPYHYCIGIMLDGSMALEQCGSVHVMSAGAISILEPGRAHGGWRLGERPFRYKTLYFPASYFAPLSALPPHFPAAPLSDPPLFALLRELHREAESGTGDSDVSASFAACLPALLAHALPDDRRTDFHPAVVQSVDLLEQQDGTLGRTGTLDYLATRVGLHPVYLSRLFARSTGLPPHAFRTSMRLQRAKSRIGAGVRLAQVAAESGFSDQSHLTRQFKRQFGLSPGAYARQLG